VDDLLDQRGSMIVEIGGDRAAGGRGNWPRAQAGRYIEMDRNAAPKPPKQVGPTVESADDLLDQRGSTWSRSPAIDATLYRNSGGKEADRL
jgi:hypothetical protein